jgi:hypothetical protein
MFDKLLLVGFLWLAGAHMAWSLHLGIFFIFNEVHSKKRILKIFELPQSSNLRNIPSIPNYLSVSKKVFVPN